MKARKNTGIKIVCNNRKARFNYFFQELIEAGIVLKGSEVKSLREGNANIPDAYATAVSYTHLPLPQKLLV